MSRPYGAAGYPQKTVEQNGGITHVVSTFITAAGVPRTAAGIEQVALRALGVSCTLRAPKATQLDVPSHVI